MLFTSNEFLIFFTAFFLLYWFVCDKNVKHQNILVLLGSYLFYAWWDWRFLSILITTSIVNFILGIYIEKTTVPKSRKLLLWIGLLQGVGCLLLFKYFNFFVESFSNFFSFFHFNIHIQTINIIIPLGLSYYTFKSISYLLDIEKGKIKATAEWMVFCSYIAFFPALLAGPIDKARTLIPQLEQKRVFDYNLATDGLRQILWGVFKKVVIADNCASITNHIFDNYQHFSGSTLLIGAFLYTIQMYADFSGYSDMAIGFSRLIGFNITRNFDFPFFSQNIAEFWRKWHISLTSWLTEYVFTPLSIAFRDLGKLGLIFAIIINFTICGIWHGANWTYVLFGLMHGCYFIPLILTGKMNKRSKIAGNKMLPSFSEAARMLATFVLVMFTFIVFRAENITQAFNYYQRLFSISLISIPAVPKGYLTFRTLLLFIGSMLLIEWLNREKEHGLQLGVIKGRIFRWSVYAFIFFLIGMLMETSETPFIYFKF
ncbi:MBOAT family protein [Chitinophagaceae bacterium LB-8]|uniref:MBOAT family protein n=1 Tax=Paraflavisolibacter caeni TaxID=2982496 RepID=A0A9X2XYD3_9BACT|nr:MBOAT family O-acyltransferase [Paraflavisolibacter caeni]MCU7551490.1 MBOAT family protein [Paraflavisolibacter caeni]